ncbi:MAG: hypothetical protein K1X92_10420 [Bacteroidia bacterium]|nr:hypothetical protein [Bacteroidia bacterium]
MEQNKQFEQRLSEFRKKFYINKILKGALILAVLTGAMLFIALMSEGLFGFEPPVRTGIVYTIGAVFLGVLAVMVIYPVTQLLKIAGTISDFQIADIVKNHFPEINDKLLNLLQLRKQSASDNNALVAAAINRKASEITPVKISSAINLKMNFRYLRWLAFIGLLFLVVYFINPELLSIGSYRLINYTQKFVPPPPFQIKVNGVPEKVIAGEPVNLNITVEGKEIPAELSIFIKKETEEGFIDYNLQKEKTTEFTYNFTDLKEDFSFYVGNPEVKTEEFKIHVVKRPFIKNFRVKIQNPAYTGLGTEELEPNIGDFKVLKGAQVSWEMEAQGDIEDAYMIHNNQQSKFTMLSEDKMSYRQSILGDMHYYLSLTSKEKIGNIDTIRYQIQTIQDRFPSIYVNSPNSEYVVDLDPTLPLGLDIGDDYGFSKMILYYRTTKSGGNSAVSPVYSSYPLTLNPKTLLQTLNYTLDLTKFGLREGDEMEYYVEVWDNDGISGNKSSKSAIFKVKHPTLDAKYEEVNQQQEAVKEDLNKLKEEADQMIEEYKKMQEKLLDQKRLSFDDKKQAQNMLKQHQDMMEKMQDVRQKMEQAKEELQNNQMISEETLKKYEELNKLVEEMKNPELEKFIKEMQEKLETLTPEQIKNKMENLQMKEEEMKKSIERTMELLKQLEVQQKIDEIKNKLDNLKAKQDMLNEKTQNAKSPQEMKQMEQMQDELNKQMKEIEKDLEELAEKKEKTNTKDQDLMNELKKDAKDTEGEMKDASEEMDESSDQQQSGDSQKSEQSKQNASKKQKSASKKMKEMSEKLSSMQMKSQESQDEQNLEQLRQLLENLLRLSFEQEDLRNETQALKFNDPALKDKSQEQKKLQDDMKLVRDSLDALAKKVVQIKQFVMDESSKVTEAMKSSQTHFRNKNIPMTSQQQHLSMTSINNLANMLSEVMKQIQAQMKSGQQNQGQGMCQKPGNKKGNNPGMQQLGQKQGQLNGMMQNMMNGGNMDPSKLAEMAAQQEAIRKQLKEMHEKIKGEEGSGGMLGDMEKVMEQMKETETELMNRQLTAETMMRQQQILSRMLQADKSVRERELDDKRESNTGRELDHKAPEQLTKEEYKNKLRQELLKTNKMEYSGDFIYLIEQYFKKIEGSR